ncbi:hypothetical protein [Brevibacillus sp. SYSU BS000544]|uniref:hypothetical protein n=1 Tax=Brevibacillus sp. SYSU BS000544 TaxID=3416443 RepID=UPI003CE58DCA
MEQKVINYYIKGLSNFRLIVKRIKIVTLFYLLSTFFWAFSFLFSFSYHKIFWLPFLTTLVQIISFFYLNGKIKRLLILRYNCRQRGLLWDRNELNQYKMTKLDRLLIRYRIDSDKLSKLSDILNKEAENWKISNYIGLGIIAVIFVPIWSEFIGWIYSKAESLTEALTSMVYLVLFGVVLWQFLWMLKLVLELFDNRSIKTKELALMIDKISLSK